MNNNFNIHQDQQAEFNRVIVDIATRSFRDQADKDYIIARKLYRLEFFSHFHWSSLQAIEKYIKCILLFNRISSIEMKHDLSKGIELLSQIEYVKLNTNTIQFFEYVNNFGLNRYLTWSYSETEYNLHKLDRSVWDLRRYCKNLSKKFSNKNIEILDLELKTLSEQTILRPKAAYIKGAFLERVLANKKHPARKDLVWQNGYFLTKFRRVVTHAHTFHFENSPLSLSPEFVKEISKLISMNKKEIEAFEKEYLRRANN